jgi:cytoskeletal protein CcmA (bactofilin family)
MSESLPKLIRPSLGASVRTVLGHTVVVQGQLSAGEDMVIDGQFEGNIHLDDHCLTVGTEGHVKAEIRARQVIIMGSVTGNLTVREKIEIRQSGHLVGDLVAAAVAIEDGAYFKGSIDIVRGDGSEASREATSRSVVTPST